VSLASLLCSTGKIERKAQASDGAGGYTESWATLVASWPCRVNALSARETEILFGKQTTLPGFVVYGEQSTAGGVKEGDRVTVSSKVFDIKKVDNWDLQNIYLKLACVEFGRDQA
jgi:head-tail adaptor